MSSSLTRCAQWKVLGDEGQITRIDDSIEVHVRPPIKIILAGLETEGRLDRCPMFCHDLQHHRFAKANTMTPVLVWEAQHPRLVLFLRVWTIEFIISPIIGVSILHPSGIVLFPFVYIFTYGYPLVIAIFASFGHALMLVLIATYFDWLKRPFDPWRCTFVGLLTGAPAGFLAVYPTEALYEKLFAGNMSSLDPGGAQWIGLLAGALCGAIVVPLCMRHILTMLHPSS